MEISCPSCGKLTQARDCPRCACELGDLFEIRGAAGIAVARAAQSLRQGEANVALDYASEAWALRHSVEAARIGVLACIAMHDFPAAQAWRRRVGSVKSG